MFCESLSDLCYLTKRWRHFLDAMRKEKLQKNYYTIHCTSQELINTENRKWTWNFAPIDLFCYLRTYLPQPKYCTEIVILDIISQFNVHSIVNYFGLHKSYFVKLTSQSIILMTWIWMFFLCVFFTLPDDVSVQRPKQ